MNKLIDTHFHLDYYRDHSKIYKMINELQQYTICVTNQPEVFESCIDLYPTTKYIKFALGYNPQSINDVRFNKAAFLRNLQKTKYIGEVGLDFSEGYKSKKAQQIEILEFICKNAKDKIFTMHCKGAERELFEILKESGNHKIILHWYNGDVFWIKEFLNLGCYFSINGSMLNSVKGKNIIRNIPKDRLLIESDGPFGKVNGKRFTCNQLGDIYMQLGNYLKINDISEVIVNNFVRLVK